MKQVVWFTRMVHVMILLCGIACTSLAGQERPLVEIRFTNPVYDVNSRMYSVDAEMMSLNADEEFFGMNLRFFYDATFLQFKAIDQVHQGYGFLGTPPKAVVGGATSGSVLFDFDNKAGYINSTVILTNALYPLALPKKEWVKAFRVKFFVPLSVLASPAFCPSIIWDKEFDPAMGGFLQGSEGVLIAVVEKEDESGAEALVADTYGHPFNWEYYDMQGLPHGQIVSETCIPINNTITEEPDKSPAGGYDIAQNTPNPFSGETTITFTLPKMEYAALILYDAEGTIRETIEGQFNAGENKVLLRMKSWMLDSGVIYYRLQTDTYRSGAISMVCIRA